MKPNMSILLSIFLLASLLSAAAGDAQAQFDAFAPVEATREWKPNPALWRDLLRADRPYPTIPVGPGKVVVRGPLVETFRRPREWADLNRGQKILSLPVVNWFVPMKMPRPPGGGGKYFAWGESHQSWTAITAGAVPATSPINHEAQGLISFGR